MGAGTASCTLLAKAKQKWWSWWRNLCEDCCCFWRKADVCAHPRSWGHSAVPLFSLQKLILFKWVFPLLLTLLLGCRGGRITNTEKQIFVFHNEVARAVGSGKPWPLICEPETKEKAQPFLAPEIVPWACMCLSPHPPKAECKEVGLPHPPCKDSPGGSLLGLWLWMRLGGEGHSQINGFPQEGCRSYSCRYLLPDPCSA